MSLPCTSATGGTIWIYTGAYNAAALPNTTNAGPGQAAWVTMNRAKSRDRTNYNNVYTYHGWGYAWLVNRRVLYNNNNTETAGFDVADFPMGPDQCSRLFVSTNTGVLNYSRFYRTIHRLADVPKNAAGAIPAFHSTGLPGRFPSHVEPYESPRTDWQTWGKNTAGGAPMSLLPQVGPATPGWRCGPVPAGAHDGPLRRALPGRPHHS